MGLIARLLYAAAVILLLLMVLVLLNVIALHAGWVALLIAAVVCAVVAYCLEGAPRYPRSRL